MTFYRKAKLYKCAIHFRYVNSNKKNCFSLLINKFKKSEEKILQLINANKLCVGSVCCYSFVCIFNCLMIIEFYVVAALPYKDESDNQKQKSNINEILKCFGIFSILNLHIYDFH